uniref:Uncharacterized protein n=1 Tax=Manihot esculenta TaxID=3983 RepID=A0A2C9VJT5_MANES
MASELDYLHQRHKQLDSKSQARSISHHSRTQKAQGVIVSENSSTSTIVSKFTKLDFSRFNGQEDSLGWLNRYDKFFQH